MSFIRAIDEPGALSCRSSFDVLLVAFFNRAPVVQTTDFALVAGFEIHPFSCSRESGVIVTAFSRGSKFRRSDAPVNRHEGNLWVAQCA
jgi:hypothetical protein